MLARWTRGLSEEEIKQLKKDYMQATLLRERFVLLLEQEVAKSLKEMRDVARNGSITNLTEYYVDELSRQRTLEEIIKLIQ
jgi:hypothetical protein|tara:strand:+ start:4812 stop:5054 length:243 start_codon:yes stop_codon:yes gene_type:complete